jgi:hypothetical protein
MVDLWMAGEVSPAHAGWLAGWLAGWQASVAVIVSGGSRARTAPGGVFKQGMLLLL